MRPADTRRIVKTGIGEAAGLKVLDPLASPFLPLVLGAPDNRLCRAGFCAGRPLADRDAVGAERALVGRVIDTGDARDVERAALDAVAAADAVLVDEVDDAVRILHDRARCRAGL